MSWSLFSSGQTLNPKSWADAVLKGLGAPTSAENEQSLIAWSLQEGSGGTYNPLNTTLSADGAEGSINSAGVKNYPNWADGVAATVATLQSSDYSSIVSDLKGGKGISQSASGELSTWGTGTWEVSIGDHWSEAAKYLSGKSSPLPGGGSATPAPSNSSGGLLSFPSEITGFFSDADKIVTTIAWLAAPASWVRIVAFLAGVALLLFAIHALVAVRGNGDSIMPKTPSVIPVPIPI